MRSLTVAEELDLHEQSATAATVAIKKAFGGVTAYFGVFGRATEQRERLNCTFVRRGASSITNCNLLDLRGLGPATLGC